MLYIYGVAQKPFEMSDGGVGGLPCRVYTVQESALGALVSEISDPSSVSVVRDAVLHQKVLEEAMTNQLVLPVSFGTFVESESSVRQLLRSHSREFHDNFARLDGKVEAGIKVFWQREAVLKELAPRWGSMDDLRQGRSAGAGSGDLPAQFGKAVHDLLEHWKSAYLPGMMRAFEATALESQYNPPIGVRMLLNAAYLVERENGPRLLRQALLEVDGRYGDRMRFHLVAPLPPYNFVQIRIEPEEVS